jgi:hypothetical protein
MAKQTPVMGFVPDQNGGRVSGSQGCVLALFFQSEIDYQFRMESYRYSGIKFIMVR